jgi:hypothetical protein
MHYKVRILIKYYHAFKIKAEGSWKNITSELHSTSERT